MMIARRVIALAVSVVTAVLTAGSFLATDAAWTDSSYVTVQATAAGSTDPTPIGPLTPGDETIIGIPDWNVPDENSWGFCSTFTVSTESSEPVTWSVIIDMTRAPYAGATMQGDASYTKLRGMWPAKVVADPDDDSQALLVGESGQETVVAGQPRSVGICIDNPLIRPPGDSSWYDVSVEHGTSWGAPEACLDVTFTGKQDLDTYPFYFGWETTLDLSEPLALLADAGVTPDGIAWSPDPSQGYNYNATALDDGRVPTKYRLTSGLADSIRGTESFTLTACVRGHTG
ncbi:hypothetical protein PU630_06005 [Microbacterium horticulturae]|uniref:Uncharacterized protein n=1 Tax=Microbacterium horticulturae TaxID=3028316 RepID=A0ABY8C0Y8_9MICO|nr:hypothetical protein [Microbacterium sp. KACC 23027]WEG10104.1 hypothetical protein PU630_06005 [Microbacterium sp. KACC 23027]